MSELATSTKTTFGIVTAPQHDGPEQQTSPENSIQSPWQIWPNLFVSILSASSFLSLVALASLPQFINWLSDGNPAGAFALSVFASLPVLVFVVADILNFQVRRAFFGASRIPSKWFLAVCGSLAICLIAPAHPPAAFAGLGCLLLGGGTLWFLARGSAPSFNGLSEEKIAHVMAGQDIKAFNAARDLSHMAAASSTVKAASAFLSFALAVALLPFHQINTLEGGFSTALALGISVYFILGQLQAAWHPSANKPSLISPPEDAGSHALMPGLSVQQLTAFRGSTVMLNDVTFTMPPNSILGVDGECGSGKSLLLKTLADPRQLSAFRVRGRVTLNGHSLWHWNSEETQKVVYCGERPLIVPTSGEENLVCRQEHGFGRKAKRELEDLLFSDALVEDICTCPDATELPTAYQKLITFARGFAMSPDLYIFDRPEDGIPEKQIVAFAGRLKEEVARGKSVLMATKHRALQEICDDIMVLQGGKIVDFGAADQIMRRTSIGWSRFVAKRSPRNAANLEAWLHGQFIRPGDNFNRSTVAYVGTQILNHICDENVHDAQPEAVTFEFKNFVGYCILKVYDTGCYFPSTVAPSTESGDGPSASNSLTTSALSSIARYAQIIDQGRLGDRHSVTLKIKTIDPRTHDGFKR